LTGWIINVDAIYIDETSLEFFYGPMGVGIGKETDGSYYLLPTPEGKTWTDWNWTVAINNYAPGYITRKTNDLIKFDVMNSNHDSNEDKKLLRPYYFKEYFPYTESRTLEEIEELSTLSTDIWSAVQSQVALWITQGGVEKEYDGFVKLLKNIGIDRYLEIQQNIYNRYWGK
jgi:putative aldouronate transport system substrate-binding protein